MIEQGGRRRLSPTQGHARASNNERKTFLGSRKLTLPLEPNKACDQTQQLAAGSAERTSLDAGGSWAFRRRHESKHQGRGVRLVGEADDGDRVFEHSRANDV